MGTVSLLSRELFFFYFLICLIIDLLPDQEPNKPSIVILAWIGFGMSEAVGNFSINSSMIASSVEAMIVPLGVSEIAIK